MGEEGDITKKKGSIMGFCKSWRLLPRGVSCFFWGGCKKCEPDLAQVSGTQLADATPWSGGTFGDALLAPTNIYVRRLLSLMDKVAVKVQHNFPAVAPWQSACLQNPW